MVSSRSGRVTTTAVSNLKPGEILRDFDVRGFGVRRRTGQPSYFLQTRVAGRLTWITIGKHGSPWTPATARKEAIRLLGEINEGVDPNARKRQRRGEPTLAVCADEFLEMHGSKLRRSTYAEYGRLLQNFIVPALGSKRISDITRADVTRFHRALAETPRQANLSLAVLSKLMSWCEIEGLRKPNTNPCRLITKYREVSRQRFLQDEELDRLGQVLHQLESQGEENPYVIGAIRLLLLTGMRLGEVLSLEWRFIDLQRGLIALPDSKTGQKAVFLNPAAREVLIGIPRVPDNPYVIVGHREGQHLINLQKPWRRIRALARLDDVRIHDLRHSFASMAAAHGASLQLIGRLLGHTSPQTTERYAHLVADHVREANDTVGAAIAGHITSRRPR